MASNRLKKLGLSIALIIVLIPLVFIGVVLFSLNHEPNSNNAIGNVQIKDKFIKAEIVKSDAELYLGLSQRTELCSDCGMLFIFPDKQARSFEMRNMNFPLDIVFINDGRITNIAAQAPPEGEPATKVYQSVEAVDAVLEVNASFCENHNILVGDRVTY